MENLDIKVDNPPLYLNLLKGNDLICLTVYLIFIFLSVINDMK
jgi:hypothetical protein